MSGHLAPWGVGMGPWVEEGLEGKTPGQQAQGPVWLDPGGEWGLIASALPLVMPTNLCPGGASVP